MFFPQIVTMQLSWTLTLDNFFLVLWYIYIYFPRIFKMVGFPHVNKLIKMAKQIIFIDPKDTENIRRTFRQSMYVEKQTLDKKALIENKIYNVTPNGISEKIIRDRKMLIVLAHFVIDLLPRRNRLQHISILRYT